jgi:hypothetical protein
MAPDEEEKKAEGGEGGDAEGEGNGGGRALADLCREVQIMQDNSGINVVGRMQMQQNRIMGFG